ncbi:MAG: hypothetical protein J6Y14_04980 [Fibrobacter sp.]|nr:hypothetical protein [Fibrobacter sp.]
MNIRKFWRLSCLTVASLFWASCGSDSNPQFAVVQSTNPDSSADVGNLSSASSETESSASVESVSSSSQIEPSSSAKSFESSSSIIVPPQSSSDTPASSSSSVSSSSTIPTYILARDSSVTCTRTWHTVSICAKDYDCNDLKNFLEQKQSVSEKLLTYWEDELASCGTVIEQFAPLYGIGPCASTRMKYEMKCSNDSTYENFRIDGDLAYTCEKEYNDAHGIVPEDLVESCPQEGFALFVDILADVQKALYEKIVNELMKDLSLTESQTAYLESLLDRENKTLKYNLAPYFTENGDVKYTNGLNYESENWFGGYIAKTKTCEDGTPVITERYQQKYDAILAECIEIIEKNLRDAGD